MSETGTPGAASLRKQFRALPKEGRDANQDFSIRVWRGLSWLERGEIAADLEGRFIFLWIAFNSIYGYLNDDGRDARDRASWQTFLARLVERDGTGRIDALLRHHQQDILPLIDNRYLFRPFWMGLPDADEKLRVAVRRSLKAYNDGGTVAVLQELFERLYVMRMQVFHGAATSGSRLNRPTLERSTKVLAALVPEMLAIMVEAGPDVDWGEVCFPPTEDGRDG
jgi:hypothetical protein